MYHTGVRNAGQVVTHLHLGAYWKWVGFVLLTVECVKWFETVVTGMSAHKEGRRKGGGSGSAAVCMERMAGNY